MQVALSCTDICSKFSHLFYFHIIQLFSIFAKSSRRCFVMKRGGGDGHINNGVFIRVGFDDSKSWKNFQIVVKDKATEDARWVC